MKDSFTEFIRGVPSFHGLSPADKIIHVAWYLHSLGKTHVTTSEINQCFSEIHTLPPHTSVYLKRLAEKKPPILLRERAGYRLEGRVRGKLGERYGSPKSTIVVSSLLKGLVDKVVVVEEQTFLLETLKCYSVQAFRAAIVMAWNLGYFHLIDWILLNSGRVDRFNSSYAIKYPKRAVTVSDHDGFSDLKEYDVVETAAHAKLISKNVAELMKEKLKRRNAAAHPSSIHITQAQADDVITDLVNNVIAKLG